MRLRPLTFLLLTLLSVGCLPPAIAGGVTTITLRATRTALLADGKQTTTIRAEVRDSSGRYANGNTFVQFQTTGGTLSASQAPASGGIATVTLSSATTG